MICGTTAGCSCIFVRKQTETALRVARGISRVFNMESGDELDALAYELGPGSSSSTADWGERFPSFFFVTLLGFRECLAILFSCSHFHLSVLAVHAFPGLARSTLASSKRTAYQRKGETWFVTTCFNI